MSEKEKLIYVRYKDSILFRNLNPELFERPNLREAVGWFLRENEEVLIITYDRSAGPLPFEKNECGLVILKSNILEQREIKEKLTV